MKKIFSKIQLMREFTMTQFTEWRRGLFRMVSERNPRHLQLLRPRMYLGGLVSLAIHLIIFLFIFASRPDNLSGIASNSFTGSGNDTATFQSVRLVSAPLNSEEKPAQSENSPLETEAEKLPREQDTADTAKPFEEIPSPEPLATNASPLQAAADVSKPSDAAANGSPDGTQNILSQIARCLPPGSRPTLVGAQLHLELDEIGALLAVPKVSMDLATSSKADVKSANQIIQAALQCGPYVTAQNEERSFVFSPNFSGIP
ncbi:hypothetical protein [Asticcacaulis machinosus]|uniref:Uncharacterized protein n=1 Tax=Asticcacaulis machinosus TaxID=2984211 RepID=A0ABT5HH11_9CAUL|nr:hypothetical protein [Asticcacaulis machinosus]MDC7675542.1 hypothetical protein [Asticcacaulis machinosus]